MDGSMSKEAMSELAGAIFLSVAAICVTFLISQCQSRNFEREKMCLDAGGTITTDNKGKETCSQGDHDEKTI